MATCERLEGSFLMRSHPFHVVSCFVQLPLLPLAVAAGGFAAAIHVLMPEFGAALLVQLRRTIATRWRRHLLLAWSEALVVHPLQPVLNMSALWH